MKRCVFFDRDGIVNRSPGPGYVERWNDFFLFPEFIDVLRLVDAAAYVAVVVTNQRGVARGLMTRETVEDIHRRLQDLLREQSGLTLLDILYCPHEEGECDCRKPRPGMLIEAARRHGIDLAASWMVGDSEHDVEAGKRAGCRTIRVAGENEDSAADVKLVDLGALARWIREGGLSRPKRPPLKEEANTEVTPCRYQW